MSEKIYVGKGKLGKFDTIRIGLNAEKLPQPNERGYINLVVSQMKETDKWGNTHTVYVDDYQKKSHGEFQNSDGLPF